MPWRVRRRGDASRTFRGARTHSRYDTGELKGDAEDLEEHEVLSSAPKTTRSDGTIKEVEAAGRQRRAPKSEGGDGGLAPGPPGESEYERHRRERIAENQRFLQSLGFTGGDVGLPAAQPKKRGPRKKSDPGDPIRSSGRVKHEAGQHVRRVDISLMNRGDAAAGTWIFRGDTSRGRHGCHVGRPRGRRADEGMLERKVSG